MQPGQDNINGLLPSPLTSQSIDAFYRDLPELLEQHNGKWVAYHGDKCIGVGPTETELYQKCFRLGLKEDEFAVLFAIDQALYDREEIELPPER
jgi:hypothetical protein